MTGYEIVMEIFAMAIIALVAMGLGLWAICAMSNHERSRLLSDRLN